MAHNSPKDIHDVVKKLFPLPGSGHDPPEASDFEDWSWGTDEPEA